VFNETQHLLVCAMEECSEIQKDCAKALRFGLDDHHPKYEPNAERIINEFIDLVAIMTMMKKKDLLPWPGDEAAEKMVGAKIERVEKYMAYAREKGALE
jgi:hypothetical protein